MQVFLLSNLNFFSKTTFFMRLTNDPYGKIKYPKKETHNVISMRKIFIR